MSYFLKKLAISNSLLTLRIVTFLHNSCLGRRRQKTEVAIATIYIR
jgi:hypothetical protein